MTKKEIPGRSEPRIKRKQKSKIPFFVMDVHLLYHFSMVNNRTTSDIVQYTTQKKPRQAVKSGRGFRDQDKEKVLFEGRGTFNHNSIMNHIIRPDV